MKRLLVCLGLAVSLLPSAARAQVGVNIDIALPVAPPLVVVQPGVQVVENSDEEVFVTNGWYWCRRGDHWYRARSPRSHFVYVEPAYVPSRLMYMPPPGHYRHWRREQAREDRRWWKEHARDERRWRHEDHRGFRGDGPRERHEEAKWHREDHHPQGGGSGPWHKEPARAPAQHPQGGGSGPWHKDQGGGGAQGGGSGPWHK